MAVVFDAQSNADITGSGILSFSSSTTLTVGTGANRALVVAVQWNNSTAPTGVSITWDGQALTLIPNTSIGNGSAGNCALYGLINPNSGTKTLAGSWNQSSDFYCGAVAYTGVDQTSIAVAFPNGTTATGAATPATITQASSTSDAVVGSIVTNTTLGPVTAGTQIYLDNAQPLISGAGVRGAGATNVTLTATTGGGWAASSVDVKAASASSLTTGGTVFQSDVTDTWQLLYQAKAEPVFVFAPAVVSNGWFAGLSEPVRVKPALSAHHQQFLTQSLFPIAVVVVPYAGWDDTLEWPRPAQPRSPAYSAPFLAFTPTQTATPLSAGGIISHGPVFQRKIIYQATAQPVTVTATPVVVTGWFTPLADPTRRKSAPAPDWSFVQPPAQVFFPYAPWDDFTRRKPQPLDTQPLAWPATPVATPFPAMGWNNWPDFATKAKRAADFTPWTFIPPPAQVWFPYGPWDDFTRRKPQPLDTQPLAWPPTPVATPFPAMGWINWPDFAPRAKSAVDFRPWSFIPSPAQVFFPYAPWDDFTRRKPQPLDTQPLAYSTTQIAAPAPVMAWTNWPDFAIKKAAPLNFDPLALVQLAPQVWYPPNSWPDYLFRKSQPVDTQPLAFYALPIPNPVSVDTFTADTSSPSPFFRWRLIYRVKTEPVFVPPSVVTPWTQWTQWPDRVAGKPVADFRPWTFIPSPAQVWFSYGPWDDFTRRKPQPLDTQPLVWSGFTPAPTVAYVTVQWPDFATKKVVPLNYVPLTLVQTVQAPWTQWTQWPDLIWKKSPPIDTQPLAYLQTVRTPWNELSRWPELVPIRRVPGLGHHLQNFMARGPGTIFGTTVNVTLSAFEVNSDGALFAIYVIQSQPAVTAAVSIQEIGVI